MEDSQRQEHSHTYKMLGTKILKDVDNFKLVWSSLYKGIEN